MATAVAETINHVDAIYQAQSWRDGVTVRVALTGTYTFTSGAPEPWSERSDNDVILRAADSWADDQIQQGNLPHHDNRVLLSGNDLQSAGNALGWQKKYF